MISVITLTLGDLTRPATIRGTRDIRPCGVGGVGIVSTLYSDSH